MAVAKTKLLSFFSCIIYLMGTVDSTQDVYRNIWAVKVRGSLQDAKQLSFKHGFVYDKHVSSSSLTLVKSTQNPFQYHHCIVETRIAKNGNCIIYQERETRQAKASRTKPFLVNNAVPRFWTLSPGLQIRVQNLPDNRRSLPFLVDSTI